MRFTKSILTAVLAAVLCAGAYADLQMVTVDGSLRIRGNMYEMDSLGDTSFVEQRTRLGVNAYFTDNVSAYIELDSYDNWGEDFRSNPWTAADGRAASVNDVEVYQAYIQASEMWGTPLQLRIGRQEVSFGSEWLVGVQDAKSAFTGLSFDGVRATYGTDRYSIDLFWFKLFESFGEFNEDDVNFYGAYFSYLGLDNHVFDAYYLYVDEDDETYSLPFGGGPGRFGGGPATAVWPMLRGFSLLGNSDANHANVQTVGLRGAGTFGAFDYEAEVAYQFGEVGLTSGLFADPELDFSELGANVELGYTFDLNWNPRIFLGAAYFGGGDAGDTGGLFRPAGNDLAFNRLFSNWEYSEFLANTDLSNVLIYRGGISVAPSESCEFALLVSYFEVDDALDTGGFLGDLFGWEDDDDALGLEVGLYADYTYSSDLTFRAGYAHFFGDDGLGSAPGFLGLGGHPGNPVNLNGTAFLGADEDDDYDYLFIETELTF